MAAKDPIKLLKDLTAGFDTLAASIAKIKFPKKSTGLKELKAANVKLIEQNKLLVSQIAELIKANNAYGTSAVKNNKKAADSLKGVTKREDELLKKLNKAKSALKKQRTEINSFTGRIKADFRRQLAWYPAKTVTLQTLAIPKNVIQSYSDFEDRLYKVKSIGQLTTSQMQDLSDTILEMSLHTKYTGKELLDATKTLAQAGFRGEELTAAIDPTKNLATATGSDMSTGTDVMSTVIRAYKKQASDFAEISDQLTNAVINSKLSLTDLSTSFGYAASAAAQTGVSLTQTISLLGVLANSGLKASTAATGLRMALLKITAPTRKGKKVLAEAGLSPEDLDIAKNGIYEVLKAINKLNKTQIIDFFGARSANAVLAFKNVTVEAIEELEKLVDTAGTAAAMEAEQMLSLANSWKEFKNSLTGIGITAGETFGKELALNIRAAAAMMRDLIKYVGGLRNLLVGIIALKFSSKIFGLASLTDYKKALNAIILTFARFIGTVGTGTGVISAFSSSVAGLGASLAPLVPVVIALGAALVAWQAFNYFADSYVDSERFRTSIVEANAAMVKLNSSAQELIITMSRMSKANIGQKAKDAIIEEARQKLIKQYTEGTNKYIEAVKNEDSVLARQLENLQKQGIQQINDITDPTQVAAVIKKNRKAIRDLLLNYDPTATLGKLTESQKAAINYDLKRREKLLHRLQVILGKQTKKAQKLAAKSYYDFVKDPANTQLLSDARTHGEKANWLSEYTHGLEDTQALKEHKAALNKLAEGLRKQLENSDLAEDVKAAIQEDLNAVELEASIIDLYIQAYIPTDDEIGKFKIMAAAAYRKVNSAAIREYEAGIKAGLASSKLSAAIKAKYKQKFYNDLVKPFEDEAPELVAKLKKLAEEFFGSWSKDFDKHKDDKTTNDSLRRQLYEQQVIIKEAQAKILEIRQKGLNDEDRFNEIQKQKRIIANAELKKISIKARQSRLAKDANIGLINREEKADKSLAKFKSQLQKEKDLVQRYTDDMRKIFSTDVTGLRPKKLAIELKKEKKALRSLYDSVKKYAAGIKDPKSPVLLFLKKLEDRINKLDKKIKKTGRDSVKEDINDTRDQIGLAVGERDFAEKIGDSDKVEQLNIALMGLYTQLRDLQLQAAKLDLTNGLINEEQFHVRTEKIQQDWKKMIAGLTTESAKARELYNMILDDTRSGFEDFFTDVMDGNKSLVDSFKDLGKSILDIFKKLIAKLMAEKMMSMIFGSGNNKTGFATGLMGLVSALVGKAHSGGTITSTTPKLTRVDPTIFFNAPRLHTGLLSDEFPAILQKGESVIPKGAKIQNTAPKVIVNVENKAADKASFETTGSQWNGEEFVVNTIIKNINSNGPLRALVSKGAGAV